MMQSALQQALHRGVDVDDNASAPGSVRHRWGGNRRNSAVPRYPVAPRQLAAVHDRNRFRTQQLFMRKAAAAGRGSYVYISDVKQVHAKMAGLFKKLERPALTGCRTHGSRVAVPCSPKTFPPFLTYTSANPWCWSAGSRP